MHYNKHQIGACCCRNATSGKGGDQDNSNGPEKWSKNGKQIIYVLIDSHTVKKYDLN